MRDTRAVLMDHLRLRAEGDLKADLSRNYDPRVLLLTANGVLIGHEGVRRSASLLRAAAPDSQFEYSRLVCRDRVALLEWSGSGAGTRIQEGVDTYLVEDGMIVAQTIHYRVMSTTLSVAAPEVTPPRRNSL